MNVRLVIELDELEDGPDGMTCFIAKTIELPFLPVRRMTLMVGESAGWNQLIVHDVMWLADESIVECEVACCMEQDKDFAKFMQSHGWSLY